MECKRVIKNLHFFVDKRLTLKQEKCILKHLAECRACRIHYEKLRTYKNVMKSIVWEEGTKGKREKGKGKKRNFRRDFLFGVAAIFTGIFLGISIFMLKFEKSSAYQSYQYPMSFILYYDDFLTSEETVSQNVLFSTQP